MDALPVGNSSAVLTEFTPDWGELTCAFDLGRVSSANLIGEGKSANRVWRLRTARGDFAVKLLQGDGSFPVRKEMDRDYKLRFQQHAWVSGVPMPEPMMTCNGKGVARITGAEDTWAIVNRWVDGPTVRYFEPLITRRGAAKAMANALGQLHTVQWEPVEALSDGWPRDVIGEERWLELSELGAMRGAAWPERLRSALPELRFAEQIVRSAPPMGYVVMCHGDVGPHNAIRTSSKSIVVVDWDGVRPMVPTEEFAAAITSWAVDENGDAMGSLPVDMVRAYRSAGADFPSPDISVFATGVGVMLYWMHNRVGVAAGVFDDSRTSAAEAAASVDGLIKWARTVPKLETLLTQLQTA